MPATTTQPPPLPDAAPVLDGAETRRYGRHLVLPEVGMEGQQRLKAARVLLVGSGGLGSPAALYLAAAGVGRLGIVDFDVVDASNLQRQVLYGESDLGRPKVQAARDRLADLNPHIEIDVHEQRLRAENVVRLLEGYDLVLDGSDNFPTRYLVNDACVLLGKPLVWGAVLRFEGQVSLFGVEDGPCYRCLFPEPPPAGLVPSCAEGGVLGVLPGIIGSLQANEAIKWILGVGEPLSGRFLVFDALRSTFRELTLPKNPDCPSCAPGRRPELRDLELVCAASSAEATPAASTDPHEPVSSHRSKSQMSAQPQSDVPAEIDVHQLASWRQEGVEHVLVDVREVPELAICQIDTDAVHIPLGQIPHRCDELESGALLVVHCHHGGRSAQAVQFLRSRGFDRATNLAGGIDHWSLAIDPSVRRY